LVAHTGFEPVISSLRGRCPKPLDECATWQSIIALTQAKKQPLKPLSRKGAKISQRG
jgi:hypothetical protein